MSVTLDHAEGVAKALAEVCSDDEIRPADVAKGWRLEFASWTNGELTEAVERWKVAHAAELLPSFPKAKELRPFRPDPVREAKAAAEERLRCICDGDGMTTWSAANGIGASAPGEPSAVRVMNGAAGETVVIPCYYCNRVRFEVWWMSVNGEPFTGSTAPEWASTPRPKVEA